MPEGPTTLFADARIAIGAQPVSAAEPAGTDIRRESDFETLEAEVRRMDADGPNAVRWRIVVDGATAIIGQRSKDLLVGVWLAYGLAREDAWPGLAVGLSILRDMVDTYWDNLQPGVKRERARVGAAEWLVGRLVPLVSEWQVTDAAASAIVAAMQALDDLDRTMSARLTKESVAFGELVRAIRPKADAARRMMAESAERAAKEAERGNNPEPPPPPPAEPAAVQRQESQPVPAPAAPSVAPTPVPAVVSNLVPPAAISGDLERSVSQLETTMRQYSEALRVANPYDARSYILLRTAAWLGIAALPPQQNGRTMLPPPAQDRRGAIDMMRQAGKLNDAVLALESLISSSPFFLDGQKLVYDSLSGLGPQAGAAKDAVAAQCAAFMRRLPGVADLAFNDGHPFANTATRDWLAALAAQGNGAEGGGDGDLAAVKNVIQLAGSGKLSDAFTLLAEEMRHAGSGRARFHLQLIEAQICLEANLPAMAAPLALRLTRAVTERDLEDWEPGLAARAAEVTVRALSHAEAVKYVTESDRLSVLQAARSRLAGLDPAAAARLAR